MPERDATFADSPCAKCGTLVAWLESPLGGWWAHHKHPEDGHDAVPVVVRRLPMSEQRDAPEGRYTEVWECDAPDVGVAYRVLDQEWSDDYTVRTIRRIEIIEPRSA